MSKEQQFNYTTHGAKTNSAQILDFLSHLKEQVIVSETTTPLCIWGMHGIGKTQLVKEFAQDNDCNFQYIAPAQFEEMGDMLGMPTIDEGQGRMNYVIPDWVPKNEGPGILLIDDVNRADDRILRGIMQLLQNGELVSWKLPSKWMIVMTANPDGGDYSVTSMDDAILTRMLHVTMEYDLKEWAKWAERSNIDSRGISFVLTYPEIVNSQRTTPRSLVQFFNTISTIPNLANSLELVQLLAEGCLDKEAAIAFITFVNMDLNKIIPANEILNTKDFKLIKGKLDSIINKTPKRLDILSVIMTRVTNYLIFMEENISNEMFNNLKDFILLEMIPNDLRLSMAHDLINSKRPDLKRLYAVPQVGKLILKKM